MNEDNQAIANLSESVLQPVDVTPEKNEIENEPDPNLTKIDQDNTEKLIKEPDASDK